MALLDKMTSVSGAPANADGWRIVRQADGHFWFCLGGGTGNGCVGGSETARSMTVPALNTWYEVAAVKTSSTISLYVNGALEDTKARLAFTDTNAGNLIIGAHAQAGGAPGFFLNGLIDEVRLYNRALT